MSWRVRRSMFAVSIFVGTACLLGSVGCGAESSSGTSPVEATAKKSAPPKPAPDFTLKDVLGRDVSLSDFRGQIVTTRYFRERAAGSGSTSPMPEPSAAAVFAVGIWVVSAAVRRHSKS